MACPARRRKCYHRLRIYAHLQMPKTPYLKTQIDNLAAALLAWFSNNARDLPWRRTRDPYAIWVSEIMLQQTQVKTVIPYWERWMRALPSISDLAKASAQTVHKLWEGLGYYTRVRNMQRAAQEIIAKHGSEFPRDYEAILALPGIGRYTAGAISSIAFNQPQPILDGNVIRVLTRVFGITENPKDKVTNEKLWKLAQELVTVAHGLRFREFLSERPLTPTLSPDGGEGEERARTIGPCSALNQSLMELGALICTPKQPQCLICPIQKFCDAYKTGRTQLLPNLGPRIVATERQFIAFVVENRGRYLVRQRPEGQVNAHLWEFPNVEITPDSSTRLDQNSLAELAGKQLDLQVADLTELCTIRHSITRYRITLRAFRASGKSKIKNQKSKMEWLALADLDKLAFTSAHRKILQRIQETRS